MTLFVKLQAGNSIPFEVDASDLIESVKMQIEQKESIPRAKQALRYAGRTLLSQRTFGHYSIIEGTTIDLAVWMELEIVVRKRVWVEVEEGSNIWADPELHGRRAAGRRPVGGARHRRPRSADG